MHNCIFTAHCMESCCDKSCPMLVETSYLLERNNISMSSPVFYKYSDKIDTFCKLIDDAEGRLSGYVVTKDMTTTEAADLITYCAICKYWKGSQLHCTVYNLRFSKYLDELKKSWNSKLESESLEFMNIWTESAKVLIISNFDYIKFGDFESQTMLNMIQTRQAAGLTTIFVTPPTHNLICGNSSFATILMRMINEASGQQSRFHMKLGGNR